MEFSTTPCKYNFESVAQTRAINKRKWGVISVLSEQLYKMLILAYVAPWEAAGKRRLPPGAAIFGSTPAAPVSSRRRSCGNSIVGGTFLIEDDLGGVGVAKGWIFL